MAESIEFTGTATARQPMIEMLRLQKTQVLTAAGLIVVATITIWMSVFMPTYAVRQFHVDPATAFLGTIITGAIIFVLSPPIGWLSDAIGRAPTMIASVIATIVLAYPAFALLQQFPTLSTLVLVQGVLGVVIALYFAPLPALMSDIFPARNRTSGLSLSYNLGVTIFGGFAPFVLTGLGSLTANPLAPSYYVIFGAVLSGIALYVARTRLRIR